MGLFTKNKSSQKRFSLLQQAQLLQLHHRSQSSVGETSEFLLTASASSYSSQDSHRRDVKPPPAQLMPPPASEIPPSYRHSSYTAAKPVQFPDQSPAPTMPQTRASLAPPFMGLQPSAAGAVYRPPPRTFSMESAVSHILGASYSDEYSNVDTSSENESEVEAGRSHPYYEQWKQYYAALAAAKQAPASALSPAATPSRLRPSSPLSSPHLLPGFVGRGPADPALSRSYAGFQHGFNMSHNSSVLKKSRQSTIRSTRSLSTSQLGAGRSHISPPSTRAISVNVAAAEPVAAADATANPDSDDFSGALPLSASRAPSSKPAPPKLIAHSLLALANDDLAISDYEAFFFNESGELEEQLQADASPEAAPSSLLTPPAFTEPVLDSLAANPAHALQPPPIPGADDLSRSLSRDSAKSFNSLQSEKKFKVGGSRRLVRTETSQSRASRFVPPMAGPPPPDFGAVYRVAPDPNSTRHSIASFPMQNTAYLQQLQHQLQQQIQQIQQLQMPGYSPTGLINHPSPSSPPPKSSDSTINAAIEEFMQLRNVIASGNKTLEYRLKWVKMLLEACNYKLYSYINIRGHSIPSEQSHANRQFFVKSFLTHLHKLLKELDNLTHGPNMKILAEACYLQGCLYKHEYVYKYEQDFGVPRDDEEAERYLLRCVDLHPGYFKAHFQLGDLYEQQNTEERYELTMMHYKESARMGFTRAIYQVAMLLLTDPRSRLTKFYKYLRNLSDTDMNSKDIVLSGFDRNELEEVVGLALFQLGKIHEGIYPGDLAAEDDFVKECLELAPVNYAKSLTYYNRAARLHCLQAQVKLGLVYENGELNRRYNPHKSIQWFIKASTSPLKFKRHPEALLGISRWFMRGSNGESKHISAPDQEKAVMWCERAIKEFNYPEAYYVMGTYAEMGLVQGSPKEWFDNAFSLGYQPPEEPLH